MKKIMVTLFGISSLLTHLSYASCPNGNCQIPGNNRYQNNYYNYPQYSNPGYYDYNPSHYYHNSTYQHSYYQPHAYSYQPQSDYFSYSNESNNYSNSYPTYSYSRQNNNSYTNPQQYDPFNSPEPYDPFKSEAGYDEFTVNAEAAVSTYIDPNDPNHYNYYPRRQPRMSSPNNSADPARTSNQYNFNVALDDDRLGVPGPTGPIPFVQAPGFDRGFTSLHHASDAKENYEINKQIKEDVHAGWFSKPYKNVQYNFSNGIATLSGWVKTEEEKMNIEKEVSKIEGVRQVNNNIVVSSYTEDLNAPSNQLYGNSYKPLNSDPTLNNVYSSGYTTDGNSAVLKSEQKYAQDYATTDNDRALNSRIRDKIGPDFKTIALRSNNGVVSITGFVTNFEQLEKLTKEVNQIDGVKALNNMVQVKNS